MLTSNMKKLMMCLAVVLLGILVVIELSSPGFAQSVGMIIAVAGNGIPGFSGDGGPAISAQFNGEGVAVDSAGNLYIADTQNHRVRKVTQDGVINTVVGNGIGGYSGDGGLAVSAELHYPTRVAVDSAGNLYIADYWNDRVRKVTPDGVISTIVEIPFAYFVATDSAGNVYVADLPWRAFAQVLKVTPEGRMSIVAYLGTDTFLPSGLAVDLAGNIYVSGTDRILKVTADGLISTIAGGGTQNPEDGKPATSVRLMPWALAVDSQGNIYTADLDGNSPHPSILRVTPDGEIGVVVPSGDLGYSGDGGPAISAQLDTASDIAVDGMGNLYIADSRIRKIDYGTLPKPLTIDTPSTLLSGFVGGAYLQTLAASGGVPPYSWTMSSGTLPRALTLSSAGVIAGTPSVVGTYSFWISVTDSASAAVSKPFSMTVIGGVLSRVGALPHISAGGGWDTTIFLINTSAAPVAARIVFRADDGSALSLPLKVTQQGLFQSLTASTLDGVINPNATLSVNTGNTMPSTLAGWADVLTTDIVRGFVMFRSVGQTGTAFEGTVPLQTQLSATMVLPYDNSAGFATGIAVANLSSTQASITVTLFDDNGSQLGTSTITVAASGHTAFMLPLQFPLAAGKRGILVFQNGTGGTLAGIGLRFSPLGTFTLMPTILP